VSRGGGVLLGMILVAAATVLQMLVDWHQQSVSREWDPRVKAMILGAGLLSMLALLIGLASARGR